MRGRLRVNDYDMAFVEAGTGDLLVLVHGSVCDQRYWVPQLSAFAEAGFRAVAPSLRHYWPERWDGHGGAFTVDQHVGDLAAFIDALGATKAHVLGHSRGAHLAFRLAEWHPAVVDRLILAEPIGVLDASLPAATGAPESYASLISDAVEQVRRGAIEEGLASFYAYALGPGSWDRATAALQEMGRDNARTLLGQINEGRQRYSRASAAAIGCPTLLVGGAMTRAAFVTVLDGLELAIPDCRRVTIPDAGHPMSIENPRAFNASVIAFLREGLPLRDGSAA
jgi:esterase